MAVKNKIQLITYPDSLGGNLKHLKAISEKYLKNSISGIHILPFFPSSADRGFAPLTYFEVDNNFGNWSDINDLSKNFDILCDFMVNHISRQSEYFKDYQKKGNSSKWADLFIPITKYWADGNVPKEDIEKIFLRKPDHPFSDIKIEQTGENIRIWTSFGTKDWSEQIDLDIHSETTKSFYEDIFKHFSEKGISIVRLDAVGYVTKKPGTNCFFIEPDIWNFMEWIKNIADSYNIDLLPEVHAHYSYQFNIANHGYYTYDFILPMLILHTLINKNSQKLQDYLKICPRKQFTMLDCHDGIPVQPDMDDILTVKESQKIVNILTEKRGANLNRILSKKLKHKGFDAHQINCTYYSALNSNDDAYIAARAIQFFSPGIPQVYYVGLLAGENDQELVQTTGEGRSVNRHNYTIKEIEKDIEQPVVQRLLKLMQFRNEHDAFNGNFTIKDNTATNINIEWENERSIAELILNLQNMKTIINYTDSDGKTIKMEA